MLYRVDYTLGLIVVGYLIGLAIARRFAKLANERIARAYYLWVVSLVCASASLSTLGLLVHGKTAVAIAIAVVTALAGVTYGVIFGLATKRDLSLLREPFVLSAFRISFALAFALAGVSKAFAMPYMTSFFAQSGYAVTFLQFIMVAEVIAGVAILVEPLVWPTKFFLIVDMIGAIYTHVHNGDPLNDSTGAINQLLRLVVFAVLFNWSRSQLASERSRRVRVALLGACAVLVFVVAVGGGALVRYFSRA